MGSDMIVSAPNGTGSTIAVAVPTEVADAEDPGVASPSLTEDIGEIDRKGFFSLIAQHASRSLFNPLYIDHIQYLSTLVAARGVTAPPNSPSTSFSSNSSATLFCPPLSTVSSRQARPSSFLEPWATWSTDSRDCVSFVDRLSRRS
jgi:hypothetical protein